MKNRFSLLMLAGLLMWTACSKKQTVTNTQETSLNKPAANKPGIGGGGNNGSGNNGGADTTKPPADTTGHGDNPPIDTNCAGIFCTEVYTELMLEVQNSSGMPVILDSYHTEDMSGNKMSSNLYEYNNVVEAYVVFNDSWVMGHQNSVKQIRFVGYKNGSKVVNEVFTINTDCCHVSKAAGKSIVIIP